jgi:hypothetical protein
MVTIMQFFKSIRYLVFSSNLSIFDLFWINLFVHLVIINAWFLLAFIPLMILSIVLKTLVDKEQENAQ